MELQRPKLVSPFLLPGVKSNPVPFADFQYFSTYRNDFHRKNSEKSGRIINVEERMLCACFGGINKATTIKLQPDRRSKDSFAESSKLLCVEEVDKDIFNMKYIES